MVATLKMGNGGSGSYTNNGSATLTRNPMHMRTPHTNSGSGTLMANPRTPYTIIYNGSTTPTSDPRRLTRTLTAGPRTTYVHRRRIRGSSSVH
jgi:hypothetical protein